MFSRRIWSSSSAGFFKAMMARCRLPCALLLHAGSDSGCPCPVRKPARKSASLPPFFADMDLVGRGAMIPARIDATLDGCSQRFCETEIASKPFHDLAGGVSFPRFLGGERRDR